MAAEYPTISASAYTVGRNGANVTITVPFTATNGNSQGVTAKYMQIHKYQSSTALVTSGQYAQTVSTSIVDYFSDYGGGSKTIYGDLWIQTDSTPNQYYARASKTVNWSAATFTVTFNENYTGGSTSTKTETYGSTWVFPTDPTRTGYSFTGWNTAADGTGTSYSAGDTVAITGNMTLYAQWDVTAVLHVVQSGTPMTITEMYVVQSGTPTQIVGVYAVVGGTVYQGV